MAEYINLDTPLELKIVWGSTFKPYTSTLREMLDVNQIPYTAADVVPASDFRDCRNELCLKCGAYTQKHLGACDGCRWRADNG